MSEAAPSRPAAKAEDALLIFLIFLRLGVTCFGGPVAHLAYFRREFVERRAWLSEASFADLLALSHFLPGPSSSQLGMAIARRRAGTWGALAAGLGFWAPAGLIMVALGTLAPRLGVTFGPSWLHGLKIAAAAVVLQAVLVMGRTLAVGPIRGGLAVGATAGLILAPGAVSQVLALIAGGLFGFALLRAEPGETVGPSPHVEPPLIGSPRTALVAIILFAILLAGLPLAAAALQSPLLALAGVFFRTGALVFGGGHVVLPLLEGEVVARGWIDRDLFLGAYGAVQALPGPLFSFAGFVGAAQRFTGGGLAGGWIGGLVALAAMFTPGFLLILAAQPVWERLKGLAGARAVVAGVNATVVGVLAAALWNPLLSTSITRPTDWALLGAGWILLAVARLPPWLVVVSFAAATGLFVR